MNRVLNRRLINYAKKNQNANNQRIFCSDRICVVATQQVNEINNLI